MIQIVYTDFTKKLIENLTDITEPENVVDIYCTGQYLVDLNGIEKCSNLEILY